MNKIKVIKTEQDYQDALKMLEDLMMVDPDPDSIEGEKLALLSAFIKDYESKFFPSSLPDPVEAIRFRMEQLNLNFVDIIPYIGSRSRVSEIFSGKRQLTIDMIRALSNGLGIPAKSLIQKKSDSNNNIDYGSWDRRLVAEMSKRGYFGNFVKGTKQIDLLNDFFSSVGIPQEEFAIMHRKSHYRLSPLTNKNALDAWAIQVFKKAKNVETIKEYRHGLVDVAFMQNLAKISAEENGPLRAKEYLRANGIILIIEEHFPKTYLDGATILIDKNRPIIGLTLRYDRLDNFWFTLMHELAHIYLHSNKNINLFYDEIESIKGVDVSSWEKEADSLAEEVLLPRSKWEVSPARLIPSYMAVNSLAKELGVHIAIIAGQIRHKGNRYNYLSKIIKESTVKNYFSNKN